MSKKITFTSIMTAIGTVASVLACIYAIKGYESSKTPTFPLDDAYTNSIEISSLTKNANRFEDFLEAHVGRVVYLNVYFDPDSGQMLMKNLSFRKKSMSLMTKILERK